jgi:hypothetical protein
MQVSGRLIIIVIFALAFAMAGGAWLYQYNYSRRSAEFWGPSSRLIGKSPELQFLKLEPAPEGDAAGEVDLENMVAGRMVVDHHDLHNQQGLIHLRHIFIQDDNFLWDARSREPSASQRDWAYALRFVEGPSEQIVLLGNDFQLLGKLSPDGTQVDVLPCPRIAAPLKRYLTDVGALKDETKTPEAPADAPVAEPAAAR